ncbi:MAG: hypothetical protein KAQ85_01675 [Thermodesulfovibrionia bacterium]|nr:hypothetical protein [Thermodesulfovibrionia bacterium]
MPRLELIKTNLRRWTFKSLKIKAWVEANSKGKVLNLFAGKVKLNLNEIRNDKNKKMIADYHKDALDFVNEWEGEKFDTIILDPPYSYRKSMEMYGGNLNSRFKLIADRIPDILSNDGRVISFGYHSTFMGMKRSFYLDTMCIFAHGGAQHCTIAIIEKSADRGGNRRMKIRRRGKSSVGLRSFFPELKRRRGSKMTWSKVNLVTLEDGSDVWKCSECGFKKKYFGLARGRECPKCKPAMIVGGWFPLGVKLNKSCPICGDDMIDVPRTGHESSEYWALEQEGQKLMCCPNDCREGSTKRTGLNIKRRRKQNENSSNCK